MTIRLSILGRLEIEGPGPDPSRLLSQPKRLALLAYLVLPRGEGWRSRDELLAMFWPELDESHARAALRQSLRYLRSTLGPETIENRGHHAIRSVPAHVQTDAAEFLALVERSENAAAMNRYGGDLLPGVEVRGLNEFEHWLSGERRRFRDLAREAAGALAERARDAGRPEEAIEWAERAVYLDPLNDGAVRRLMGIQSWAGNRAAALERYSVFEQELREQHGAVPSKATRELSERIRRAGQGTGAPSRAGGPTKKTEAATARIARGSWPKSVRVRVAATALTLTAALLVFFALGDSRAENGSGVLTAEEDRDRVAVLPFRVAGADSALAYLSEGMPDLLTTMFAGDPGPEAVPVRTVLHTAGRIRGNSSPLGREQLSTIAADLDVRWLLSGSVVGDQNRVVLTGEIWDGERKILGLRAQAHGPTDSLYTLTETLASDILYQMSGEQRPSVTAGVDARLSTLRAFLKGEQAYRRGSYRSADSAFSEAFHTPDRFPPAAVGLVKTRLAAPWLRGHVHESAVPLAFEVEEQLSAPDRGFVHAVAGPRFPARSSFDEYVSGWREAVERWPDRPESWFQWGDALYHAGRSMGIANSRALARDAFERALRLDSTYLQPVPHMIEIAADEGRDLDLRRLLSMYEARAPESEQLDFLRWRAALALQDEQALADIRRRFAALSLASTLSILRTAQNLGIGLEDADALAALGKDRWRGHSSHYDFLFRTHALALNRGRYAEAERLAGELGAAALSEEEGLQYRLVGALLTGDEPAASYAALQIEDHLARSAQRPTARQHLSAGLCSLGLWAALRGDFSRVDAALNALDHRADVTPVQAGLPPEASCRTAIEGARAFSARDPDLLERLAAWRGLVFSGVPLPGIAIKGLNPLVLARIYSEVGQWQDAWEILQRRRDTTLGLAEWLELEHRVALALGKAEEARTTSDHLHRLRVSHPATAIYGQRGANTDLSQALLSP